jgi:Tol biopolymer transport system component
MEPRISPDGTRIALSIQSGKDSDIWIYDIAKNTLTKLTFGGVNRTPAWSPDGLRVAYYSYDNGKHNISLKLADGSGSPEVLASGFGRSYVDDFAKDGSCLVLDIAGPSRVHKPTQSASDIFVLPLAGERTFRPFLETQFDEWQSAISPDGRWIAYSSNESGTYQVFVQPFPQGGGRWAVSSEEGYAPRWAPDGKTLYYYSPGKLVAVPVQNGVSFTAGRPETLISGYQQKLVDSGLMYDVSPDGTWFVITQSADENQNLRQIRLVLNWFDEVQGKVK